MSEAFECEIQARLRDVNLGGHVDNVEALRVLDEARLLFFRYGELTGAAAHDGEHRGLFRHVPSGVFELVGSQRVDYHAEMRFVPWQPFQVRIWIGHIGRTSFSVSYELRVAADQPPAITAESSFVLWDTNAGAPWPISEEVRATLTTYLDAPVELRERPGR